MSENTGIEWCDSTFNPVIGCSKIAPACDHCYAAQQDKFRHWTPEGWGGPRKRTSAANWKQPVKWNAERFCECMGCGWRGSVEKLKLATPKGGFDRDPGLMIHCPKCKEPLLKEARRRVFCASLADVFDNQWDPQWRADLFDLIGQTPNLDWLLLTKRIGNAMPMINEAISRLRLSGWKQLPWPWPNVWLGATVANQEEADRDIVKLLQVPAEFRFLSMEPLLGHVVLDPQLIVPIEGTSQHGQRFIDWIIVGGESGVAARPMSIQWARALRDQCSAAGVPFFFKQWGEWAPARPRPSGTPGRFAFGDFQHAPDRFHLTDQYPRQFTMFGARCVLQRVGKKAAGRMLDGTEHKGFPLSVREGI